MNGPMKKHQLFSLIFFTIPLSLSDKIDLSQGNGLVNATVLLNKLNFQCNSFDSIYSWDKEIKELSLSHLSLSHLPRACLKVRLHTAINWADFVSWCMLYTYEGNKMHS